MSFYDILRPLECPLCRRKHALHKHGTYNRYFYDLRFGISEIKILRYYCPGCGGTVSYLPSFAIPRRQFGAALISLCLQLVFVCGISLKGISRLHYGVSRVLVGTWLKHWNYSSIGIITVLRNHFKRILLFKFEPS